MQNTAHRRHGVVFNAVMFMFAVMVESCGFCALTDQLRFPAFAEVCSSAIHSHFSVLGCGSKMICFCAEIHMCLPGPSSRARACGSLGRREQGGDEGIPVTLPRLCSSPCPVSAPMGLCRAELGSTAATHRCR